MKPIPTRHGHTLLDCASAFQKAIRRNEPKIACYFGLELFMSGFRDYAWRRLLTVSAEDIHGAITAEIHALYSCWASQPKPKRDKNKGRIFFSKAVLILCQAPKSRDADHAQCLWCDQSMAPSEEMQAYMDAIADGERIELPDFTFDMHTRQGKQAGLTKKDFMKSKGHPSPGAPYFIHIRTKALERASQVA